MKSVVTKYYLGHISIFANIYIKYARNATWNQKTYLINVSWNSILHPSLKVPKREIFDRSDFPDFYTIKPLRLGDLGVQSSLGVFSVGYNDFNNLDMQTLWWLPNKILRHIHKKRFSVCLSRFLRICNQSLQKVPIRAKKNFK